MQDNLEEQVSKLRNTIFNMLNYANMYVVVLDEQMLIRYANTKLAIDLGFGMYKDILGKCWIEFLIEEDIEKIKMVHSKVSKGIEWEEFREYQNYIKPIKGTPILVHWFNSHINSDYNWSFSFGITKRQNPATFSMDSIRNYYREIVETDRTMIKAMKDVISKKDKHDTCEPIMI